MHPLRDLMMRLITASLPKLTEFNFRHEKHFPHLSRMYFTLPSSKKWFEIWKTPRIAFENQQHFEKLDFREQKLVEYSSCKTYRNVYYPLNLILLSDDRDTDVQNLTLGITIGNLIFEACTLRSTHVQDDMKFETTPKSHLQNSMCVKERV